MNNFKERMGYQGHFLHHNIAKIIKSSKTKTGFHDVLAFGSALRKKTKKDHFHEKIK